VNGISWAELMRFGLCDLRLEPEVFWSLTPVELMMMAGQSDAPKAIGKTGLDALMCKFPDKEVT